MSGPLLLGIDVGTTATKAALFDADRPTVPLAVARRSSATRVPHPSWSECNPEEVRDAVTGCVRELTARDGVPGRIAAIGLSGTACGAWLVRGIEPVRPAILWNDGRAADIVARWHADGRMDEIFALSGNVPFPGYTLAVLAWLAEHEPGSLAAADGMLFCKDWIRAWLTGVQGSEESDASYAPFGIADRRWEPRLLELTGTAGHAHLLPELFPPGRTDPLRREAADALGLPARVPVALGATDIVAGCVGGGAVAPDHAVTILGTSANSSLVTDAPSFEPRGIGIMAAAPLGRWVRTMVNTSGSMTLDWAAGLLSGGDVNRLIAMAGGADTSDLPVLLPYLSGAGVVSPFVDPYARGAFAGLRAGHGPAEMARAAVEGLAFAVAHGYAVMPNAVEQITAIGGAAQADLLLRTIAGATGATVTRPRGSEFGARGAALLAGLDLGLFDADAFARHAGTLEVDRTFEPGDEVAALTARFDRYRDCAAALRQMGRP